MSLRLIISCFFVLNSLHAQSINPSANTGQQSQNSGANKNNSAGQGLMSAGAAMMSTPPTIPIGIALMMMGMMAMKQGSHDKNAAGQSAQTAMASNYSAGSTTPSAPPPPTIAEREKGMAGIIASPEGQKASAAIAQAGGELKPEGVKMPDGSFKPWSAFSSASSLQQAGFDSKQLMKTVADVEKKLDGMPSAQISGTGIKEGDGPSGAVAPPAGSESTSVSFQPFSMTAAQRAKLIAGKTVIASGEPIGAKGDDLFNMIHRVYDRKREGRQFITEEGAPVQRQLASSAPAKKKP